MSDQLHERVADVLDRADAGSESVLSRSAGKSESESAPDDASTDDVFEAATDANEILEEADPDALLEAVGLDTLPDGSEPDSIPAAIARGEPEDVEALQRLLHLSRLADRESDDLEGAVGELRERIDGGSAESAAESDDQEGDDGTGGGEDESEGERAGDGDDEAGSESTDDLTDQLRSSMESSLGSFSDDIEGLQSKLEAATAGIGGDGAADAADEESAADAESEADAEAEAEADTEDDDGLLDTDLGADRDRDTSSGSPTRHSTMAPPPSERADMRGTTRHSTMPDRH